MKYLKLFENFSDIETIKDELSDIFIDFEEDSELHINIQYSKIVLDRNDWSGNFVSTKVRNVWGGEFINHTDSTIMSKDGERWSATNSYVVRITRTSYIKKLTSESLVKHWDILDNGIQKKVTSIRERAKRLGLELYGIHGTWLQLGKASHDDFSDKYYYGWDMVIDNIIFAFIPIKKTTKTNEGLFDFF